MTSGHDVADARLHREVAALQRAGLRVEVLGLGRAEDGPPDAFVVAAPRGSMAARALRALRLPWRARGAVLLTLDPDAAVGALAVRLLRRRRLVVDVHEDYARLLRDRRWARGPAGAVARAVVALALGAARRADLVTVADDHVPPLRARRRHVLRNEPDTSMLPPAGPPDPAPRAVYVGDLRASRGLTAMLDAVAAAPGWELDLVGPLAAADEPVVRERLRTDPALEGRVRLHGRLAPRQAWEVARGAWVGLLLLEDTPAFRDAVPSKLYEYLACGLVVVTTALPRPADLVRRSGAGVVVPDAAGAAAALRRLEAEPEAVARHRESATRWVAENLEGAAGLDRWAQVVAALARPRP